MKFVKLFEPLTIKNVEIRNRFVLPAMALNFTPTGFIGDKFSNFYAERAKGGVGLIIIGGCQIEARGAAPGFVAIDDDKYLPDLTKFAERIHSHGAKVIAQLYHAGAQVEAAAGGAGTGGLMLGGRANLPGRAGFRGHPGQAGGSGQGRVDA